MHTFHYRAGKSAFFGLMLGMLAVFFGWDVVTGEADVFNTAMTLVFAAGAVKLVMDSFSSTPALAFDREGLRIRRTWGQVAALRWDEVHWIKVESITIRYYGVIPVAKHEHLVVKCDGGLLGGRRLTLAAKLIQLPPGGVHQLCAALNAAHLAAVGGAGVYLKEAGPNGWGVQPRPSAASLVEAGGGTEFDAEAALARYLARKDSATEAVAPLAAAAPVAAPATPARPVFGRKSSAA
ncbi:hypothetical protein GCM10022281_15390 [Sphingomonas rosea]|uniref:PH domain-containing protein n=1 Tax=Sphingomonas rosea TaxID=335605 RepID=A0ABP7U4N7_9SPHN